MTTPETTFPLPWQPEINPTWLEKISESKVLGGQIGVYVNPTIASQSLTLDNQTDTKSILGDINFGVVLKQDGQTYHLVIGVDIWAPTGDYDKNDKINLGYNYWSFAPTGTGSVQLLTNKLNLIKYKTINQNPYGGSRC
jgi:hypothetical protein